MHAQTGRNAPAQLLWPRRTIRAVLHCSNHSMVAAIYQGNDIIDIWCPVPQIAWRLHRMALSATHEAFVHFAIDGRPMKIAQKANVWALMRGSAADHDTPTVTLDFDFIWQVDEALVPWALAGSDYAIKGAEQSP